MEGNFKKAQKEYRRIRDNFSSFHLQWHLTNQCNFRCRHCYQNDYKKETLSLAQAKTVFDDFLKIIEEKRSRAEKLGREAQRKLSITGGEPLLYEHFDELMIYISERKKDFSLGLLTNGSLLNDAAIDKIFDKYRFDAVQVSLEGMEKNNDAIRGRGNFVKAVTALAKIAKKGRRAFISFTLHRRNYSDIPEIIKLGMKLGAPVGIKRLVTEGSGRELKEFFLSPQELAKIYRYLIDVNIRCREAGRSFFVNLGCEAGITAGLGYSENNWQPSFCSAMTTGVLTPLPSGLVYSCRRLPIAVGDLKKESLFDIYKRIEKGPSLELKKMNRRCRECEFFDRCFGGARCVSYGYFGSCDLYSPDPQCLRLSSQ